MSLGLKFGIGAGTIGLGAATLALVGTGTFAQFTGQVKDNTAITAGTFHMQIASATNPVTGAPLTIGTTGGTGVVSFSNTNANPTLTYQYTVVVYNSGTLPGRVTTVVYAPKTSNTLTNAARVVVEQSQFDANCSARPTCGTYGTTYPIVQTNPHTTRGSVLPPATATFDGNTTQHLHFTSGTGSLNGYLQPNTKTLMARTTEAAVKYTVIVTFTKNIPNGAEGQTYQFELSFDGHVMP